MGCEKGHTPLEALETLLDLFLALLTLLDFLQLYLLAELLALALFPLLLRAFETRALVKQSLPNALHVRVALDHFREVVSGTGKREVVLLSERARSLSAM